MKNKFSMIWIKSTQARKQRKFAANAPTHLQSKMVGSHLNAELRGKYKRRSVRPVKGDKVKVARGQFKGKVGKIEKVDVRSKKALITGIETLKKDGSKSLYPIHVSNLIVTELNITDKKRKAALERNIQNDKKAP